MKYDIKVLKFEAVEQAGNEVLKSKAEVNVADLIKFSALAFKDEKSGNYNVTLNSLGSSGMFSIDEDYNSWTHCGLNSIEEAELYANKEYIRMMTKFMDALTEDLPKYIDFSEV